MKAITSLVVLIVACTFGWLIGDVVSKQEISVYKYGNVQSFVENYPQILPVVEQAYEDRKISKKEYHHIINQLENMRSNENKQEFEQFLNEQQ